MGRGKSVGEERAVKIFVPGRICLMGEHSDWAGGYGINIPLIPHLATGGLAYGPTLAVVGDNKNARSDPEVVSPLSKLQSILTASVKNTVAAAPANVTVIVQPTPVNLDGKLIADNTAGHQFASAAIKGMKQ